MNGQIYSGNHGNPRDVIYTCMFILQNKKGKTDWRGGKTKEETTQGQLMLYLLGAQLKRIQVLRHHPDKKPTPILDCTLRTWRYYYGGGSISGRQNNYSYILCAYIYTHTTTCLHRAIFYTNVDTVCGGRCLSNRYKDVWIDDVH